MVSIKVKLLSVAFLVGCVLIGMIIYFVITSRTPNEPSGTSYKIQISTSSLHSELFAIADGSHYQFPLSTEEGMEEKYKIIAIAVYKLLTNLKTMKQTLTLLGKIVLEEFSLNFANKVEKRTWLSLEEFLRASLDHYFQAVNGVFSNDTKLGIDYKKQIIEANEEVRKNPEVRKSPFKFVNNEELFDEENQRSFFEDKVISRQLVANDIFLSYALIDEAKGTPVPEEHFFVRALLEAAASAGYEAKINEIYQRALVKSGQVPLSTNEGKIFQIKEMERELFDTIEKGLESEPELQKNIRVLKNQIRSQLTSPQ